MRAVVYDKPFSVSVHQVEKPKLSHPDDIIVKGSPYLTFIEDLSNDDRGSHHQLHLWKVCQHR